jgi:hypothetical protein
MEGARYLEDGRLTIFRRSGIYYARLRIAASDKYICRSLKTSNEQTAIDLGRRLLFQIEQRAEEGLPPKSKLFAAVIDDYIAYRKRDHAHGKTSAGMLRQIIRVSKFWREPVRSKSHRRQAAKQRYCQNAQKCLHLISSGASAYRREADAGKHCHGKYA